MTASTAERGRITARVTAYAQEVIEQAATLTATTINQFVAQAALRDAERIVKESQVIMLSAKDTELFFTAIDNPPPVNERLAAALLKQIRSNNEESSTDDNRTRLTTPPLGWKPRPQQL